MHRISINIINIFTWDKNIVEISMFSRHGDTLCHIILLSIYIYI